MAHRRGYFGIGIYHNKHGVNIGTLWRSAMIYDAAFIFTIGRRYRKQSSDTLKAIRHIPYFNLSDWEAFEVFRPHDCELISIENTGEVVGLSDFQHPIRCLYLLGAEDHGIPREILDKSQAIVKIETPEPFCLNVAVAGTIIMHDRFTKRSNHDI